MNKYQEEYNLIEKLVGDKIYFSNHANFEEVKEVTKALNSLQEAIDKANKYDNKETPKKVNKEIIGYANLAGMPELAIYKKTCPICDKELSFEKYTYCPECGQKLDWSDK